VVQTIGSERIQGFTAKMSKLAKSGHYTQNPQHHIETQRASITLAFDLVTNQTVTPWLTSREAASYLKVEHRTLLAWARQGKVKGYALSGVRRHVWRFRTVDLDARMEVPAVLTVEAE